MAAKYEITAEQKAEIEQARAKNKDKKVEYKLKALSMRADRASAKKIGETTGYHPAYVSTQVFSFAVTVPHGISPAPSAFRKTYACFLFHHIRRE